MTRRSCAGLGTSRRCTRARTGWGWARARRSTSTSSAATGQRPPRAAPACGGAGSQEVFPAEWSTGTSALRTVLHLDPNPGWDPAETARRSTSRAGPIKASAPASWPTAHPPRRGPREERHGAPASRRGRARGGKDPGQPKILALHCSCGETDEQELGQRGDRVADGRDEVRQGRSAIPVHFER